MRYVKSAFFILVTFLFVSIARASARSVEGGDILHTATATASSEEIATFLAEAQAIHALIIECSIAHKNIKIYQKKVVVADGGFRATVQSGLDFDSCEDGKRAKGTSLVNPNIVKQQKLYDTYLRKSLMSDYDGELKEAVASIHAHIKKGHDYTDKKLELIREEIRGIQQTQQVAPQIQIIDRRPAVVTSPSSTCSSDYRRLMGMASSASMRNTPPGNMAQGEAANYYNQAQSLRCQ